MLIKMRCTCNRNPGGRLQLVSPIDSVKDIIVESSQCQENAENFLQHRME